MAIVAIVAVGILAFAIAAVVVGREARRLGSQRLQPVYRLPEAVGSVVDALDADAAAEMTEADVTEVVRIHLNLLQFDKASQSADLDGDDDFDAVIVDADDAGQVVYRRVRAAGVDVSRPHVDLIMTAHMRYLAAIGAVSPS